jgi:hypothetical protein
MKCKILFLGKGNLIFLSVQALWIRNPSSVSYDREAITCRTQTENSVLLINCLAG